jgi:hypothetical protein
VIIQAKNVFNHARIIHIYLINLIALIIAKLMHYLQTISQNNANPIAKIHYIDIYLIINVYRIVLTIIINQLILFNASLIVKIIV